MGNYLLLDGSGDCATAPKIAAYDLSTEVELVAHFACDDYTSSTQITIGNWVRAFAMFITSSAKPAMGLYNTSHSFSGKTSATALPVVDGEAIWLKTTYDGAAGEIKMYTSLDGTVWSQHGSTLTGAPSSIYTGASYVYGIFIGCQVGGANAFAGKIYRAIVRDGIDGTAVFDADFTAVEPGASSFIEDSVNAATVTLVGDAEIVASPSVGPSPQRRQAAQQSIHSGGFA